MIVSIYCKMSILFEKKFNYLDKTIIIQNMSHFDTVDLFELVPV
jgi:hypothetical protein